MNYIRRELFILSYFLRLLGRNFKKYITVAGFTYSLGTFGIYPSAKPTYFFCRYIDDLADGDNTLPNGKSFEKLIEGLIEFIKSPNQKASNKIELTLADAIKKLQKTTDLKTIHSELIHFLESMQLDYQRRVAEEALNQSEINALYLRSFSAVLNLALLGFGIQLDKHYVDKLGLVQGKVYALQDIEDDLSRAIINVPNQVIIDAHFAIKDLISKPNEFVVTAAFHKWRQQELLEARDIVDELLTLKTSKKGKKLIGVLVKPLDNYIRQELSKNPKKQSLKLATQ